MVTFPQPDGPTKFAEMLKINSDKIQQYPRVDNISEFISVVFIGSRLQYEALIPSRFKDVNELRVRTEVVYQWLNALKILNPLYSKAIIEDCDDMRMAIENITTDLIEKVTIVDNEEDILIDRVLTPEEATDFSNEEYTNACGSTNLPSSFLTRSTPISRDQSDPACSIFRGLINAMERKDEYNLNGSSETISDDHIQVDGKITFNIKYSFLI